MLVISILKKVEKVKKVEKIGRNNYSARKWP